MRRFTAWRHLPVAVVAAAILGAARPGAAESPLARFQYTGFQMGVQVRIVLYAPNEAAAGAACDAAFGRFAALNAVMSDYQADSELMRLCARAGGPPVKVSPTLFAILQRSLDMARRSGGAFDPTIGPLVRLWRRARKDGRLPAAAELQEARARVGWRRVRLNPRDRTVRLPVAGMLLDLGGIGKGFACDEAQKVLRGRAIGRALVEAGGDIVVSGPPPERPGWAIEVANPGPGEKVRTVTLANAGISSSGDTEQYVEIGGRRYSHIVDPRTGLGLTTRIAVTVVAPNGTTSDALSTAVSVLGPERGPALVRQFPGATASIRRAAPEETTVPSLRLDGGFIQYQAWMMSMDAAAWQRELDAFRRAGFTRIILQCLASEGRKFVPASASAPDPTALILDYADRNAMQVYVGLGTDSGWWKQPTDAAYLDRTAASSESLAHEAWSRYGRHRSFAGWYVPQELWDGAWDDAAIGRLRGFLRRVSDRCKALSGGKPVLLSPFFAGSVPPAAVERTYARLLDGAGIDVLLPQDGVGARHWDDDPAGHVVPYLRAFRGACLRAGVEMWVNVESFRMVHGAPVDQQPLQFASADAERLERQIAAAAPFARRLVSFDLFHYLSPYRSAPSRALYEAYVRRFVDGRFEPALGRAVEVDPVFPYYRDRSPESIAAEIRANGYGIVDYILTADSAVDPALLAALRAEGIGAWYSTFGNGVYTTKDLPPGWEAWKMVTRSDLLGTPLNDGYTRLCLNNPDYRAWRKAQIGRMLREHPFVGVNIMEPHWPEYPGPTSPAYACFCPQCLAAFRRAYPGETALPDIVHPDAPTSPARNPALWRKWLEFRHTSLTAFLNDLVNGPGGIRQAAPGRLVCTWTLALSEKDGVRRVLEDSGEDAAEIARAVRPDLHCFQTHWPDWTRADLKPDYVQAYRPFVDGLRAAAPRLPIKVQADIGSQKQNRWGWPWVEAFERECGALGAGSTTLYEYFIGGYMYTDPPRIADVRTEPGGVALRFSKRLDPKTAGDAARYTLDTGQVLGARVDGSVVRLRLSNTAAGGACTLTVRGIADAADRRLYDDFPPAVLGEQVVRFRLGGAGPERPAANAAPSSWR